MRVHNGVLGIGSKDKDFLIGSTITLDEINKKLPNIKRDIVTLDQSRSPFTHRCTSMSTLSIIYSYLGITPTKKELLRFNDFCVNEKNREPGVGNYTKTGVEIAVEFIHQNYDRRFLFFLGVIDQSESLLLLKKGYGMVATYVGNSKYNKDRDDNCIVDGVEFGRTTYGHAISCWHEGFNDTYPRRGKSNRYTVKDIAKLKENNYFYDNVYFIIPEDLIGMNKDYLKLKRQFEIYELASKMMWKGLQSVGEKELMDWDTITRLQNGISETKDEVGKIIV